MNNLLPSAADEPVYILFTLEKCNAQFLNSVIQDYDDAMTKETRMEKL